MDTIIQNYLTTKGKQIRPVMVILAAKLAGSVNERVIASASAVELLHNASLIHDDVVDDTVTRRDSPTINGSWGNHIAVLVGDYFVSMALSEAISTGDSRAIKSIASLGTLLSLGEIDQIYNARERFLDEEAYTRVIDHKTASLFIACAEMGAYAVDADDKTIAILRDYARLLGRCFQIKDDIFDYLHDDVGKPTGHDLLEGKITLPLIHTLNAPGADAAMKQLAMKDQLTPAEVETLIRYSVDNAGIDYAYECMNSMYREACVILEAFPDSQARRDLDDLFKYVISRDR